MGTRGSNGRTNTQDYTNLLYSDSDSDSRIPDLKLPPVKGKKQKKKRGSSGYARQDETSCDVWSVMKVFLLFVLLAAVAALAGVCFWSLQKINSLQEKVDRFQQSDAFTRDSITKFQTQLVSLNRSLTDLRSGAGGTKALAGSVEELKTKVKNFEETSVKLNKALTESSGLLDLPKKIEDLSSVIVTMKSRLDAIEKQLHLTSSPQQDSSDDDTDMSHTQSVVTYTQLAEEVKVLNQTLNEGLASVRHRLQEQESKTLTLTDVMNASIMGPSESPEVINRLISEAIQSAMENLTSSGYMDEMLKQVKTMVQDVEKMGNVTSLGSASMEGSIAQDVKMLILNQKDFISKGDFFVFRDAVWSDFKSINESIMTFDHEFEELSTVVSGLESGQKNISSIVEELASQVSGKMSVGTTGPTLSPNETTSKDKENEITTTEESQQEPLVHSENITSSEELHAAFIKASPLSKPLSQEQLMKLLEKTDLTPSLINSIDKDNDELFSEEEIATALGFDLSEISSSRN